MLAAVENALLPALKAALPGAAVVAGPALESATELVALTGERLVLLPPPTGDPGEARSGARLLLTQQLVGSGTDKDFTVTEAGDITEVESPPGRVLLPGDDYLVSGRTVKLFQAPRNGQVVQVRLLGASARGYVEKRQCRIDLSLSVYAQGRDRLDALLQGGLSAVLGAAVDLPRLQAAMPDGPPGGAIVRLRLLRAVASLSAVHRGAGRVDEKPYLSAVAQLLLQGELELTVALGQPEPTGTIAKVEIQSDASAKRFVRVS
jgi:hypothetical protein